eukprot:gene23867-biopygen17866
MQTTGYKRRETNDGRQTTGDKRRETNDGRQTTGDKRRETNDVARAAVWRAAALKFAPRGRPANTVTLAASACAP